MATRYRTRRVAVYVPEDPGWEEKVAQRMTELYGGCTVLRGDGLWKDFDGCLHREEVSVVYSWTTFTGLKHTSQKVRDLAQEMGKALNQESVLVELGTRTEFIEVEYGEDG